MRATDLKLRELITYDQASGYMMLGKQRIILMPLLISTRTRFLQEMLSALGKDRARAIVNRSGFEAGMAQALIMAELYDFDTPEEWLRAGVRMHDLLGYAIGNLEKIKLKPEEKTLRFSGKWRNSYEAALWKSQFGFSEEPVCWMISGFLSGYASTVLGNEILVKEVSCQAQGLNKFCVFEGRNVSAWGDDVEHFSEILNIGKLDEKLRNIQRAMERTNKKFELQKREISRLKENLSQYESESEIITRSEASSMLLALAEKVAHSTTNVLILGESGTGKELLARFIHRRSGKPVSGFCAVNCAALPPNLLESELFGHVKGAFTGADRDKTGLFVQAGHGTLFLDEVGELSLDLQAKFLRVLEEKEIRPVGGVKNIAVQARIVAATNRDLLNMVHEGRFREDLYYRLAVFPISMKPLRDLKQDILPLAHHFLNRFRPDHPGFAPPTVKLLEHYSWPGNIRELKNCVEYAQILSEGGIIKPEHLPVALSSSQAASVDSIVSDLPTLQELQKRYMNMVLGSTGQNRSEAARILGVGISTLWRWMKSSESPT